LCAQYKIGPAEWAILHSIADGENEEKRDLVLSGKVKPDSVTGLEGGCWISISSLATRWNLSDRTVARHLRTLRDCGLIIQARNEADINDGRRFRHVDRSKIEEALALIPPRKQRGTSASTEVENFDSLSNLSQPSTVEDDGELL
jgi:DNA-binding MarR family transcriptional regulator